MFEGEGEGQRSTDTGVDKAVQCGTMRGCAHLLVQGDTYKIEYI